MSSRGHDLRARNSTLRPLVFLRALGCVDARWRRLRTGYCKGFKPATGDGFAFHPHGTLTSPDRAYPQPRRRQPRLARAARVGARPPAARRAAAREHAPLRPLPRRVRLPDAAARPDRRRLARHPGPLAAARRLPRVARPARAAAHPVPVVRRAAAAGGQRVRRLAVGPALPQRQARSRRSRTSTRRCSSTRRAPAVGPGAAGRRADGDASSGGSRGAKRYALLATAAHRRARLLDAEAAARAGRALPLQDGGGDERELPPLSRRASASLAATPRWSSEHPLGVAVVDHQQVRAVGELGGEALLRDGDTLASASSISARIAARPSRTFSGSTRSAASRRTTGSFWIRGSEAGVRTHSASASRPRSVSV